MMQFKNTVIVMESIKKEIKFLIASFKDIWILLMEKVSLVSQI